MPAESSSDIAPLRDALPPDIGADLAEQGWSQHAFFLPPDLTYALAAECRARHDSGALTAAGIGRGNKKVLRTDIRGDRIAWLEAGQSAACDRYLQMMDAVRIVLNQTLYLGLEEYESHFAFYAPGTCYLPHKDRFSDDDCRTVSAVIYLNPDWLPEQGGALRLHPQDKDAQDITPSGGRLVLFLSADMLHEVLPATRDRLSLAGWFRRKPA
jgi:SM-20-related protein